MKNPVNTRSCSSGMSLGLVIITLVSILLICGTFSFISFNNAEKENITTQTPSEPDSPASKDKSKATNSEQQYGEERSEQILDFYLQKLEKPVEKREEDLLETGLNVLFAVANEAQNIALDVLELPGEWEEDAPDALHSAIMEEHKLSDNRMGQRKLEQILQRLKRFVPEKGQKYRIFLIEDEDPNAFAIAGGNIYATTGLLDFVANDDELAAVIGHEMAHIYNGHCHRKLKTLALADATLGDLGTMVANVGILLSAPFGQSDELVADRDGRKIATQAGFRNSGMLQFLKKLDRAEGGKGDLLDKMTSSLPFTSERIEYLEKD